MAKRKVDKKVVHVIQLQQSEREMMETVIAGQTASNLLSGAGAVLSGVGSVLAPFAGTLTAIGALWLAGRTFDEVKEDLKVVKEKADEAGITENPFTTPSGNLYQQMATYLQTVTWDDKWELQWLMEKVPKSFLAFNKRVSYFVNVIKKNPPANTSPAKAWISYYPANQFGQDWIAWKKQTYTGTAGGLLDFLNPF